MSGRSIIPRAIHWVGCAGLFCPWLAYSPYDYLLKDLWRDRDMLEQVLQQSELARFG